MGLILIFRCSAPLIDVLGNDGLPAAIIDMDMLDDILEGFRHHNVAEIETVQISFVRPSLELISNMFAITNNEQAAPA